MSEAVTTAGGPTGRPTLSLPKLTLFSGRWRTYMPGTDVGLALAVVALLSVLILPLPTLVLDLGRPSR